MRTTAKLLVAAALVVALTTACAHDDDLGVDVGGSCASNTECSSLCLGAPGVGDPQDYPGGFCTVHCFANNDCPRGAVCMKREGGVCLFPCENNADCTDLGGGWECRTRDHITNFPQNVCLGD